MSVNTSTSVRYFSNLPGTIETTPVSLRNPYALNESGTWLFLSIIYIYRGDGAQTLKLKTLGW